MSRGIVLPFPDLGAQMGWEVSTTLRSLYPRERPGTHCTGGWVGLRAGLDGCGKSRPHRDSIPGPSSPQPVAIPTEPFRPTHCIIIYYEITAFIITINFSFFLRIGYSHAANQQFKISSYDMMLLWTISKSIFYIFLNPVYVASI